MATTPKNLCLALTTTLTTTLYTVPAATTTKLDHIVIGNKTTAGTITLTVTDTSGSVTSYLIPNTAITVAGTLEMAAITLETGDILKGGMTACTDATIQISYTEYT